MNESDLLGMLLKEKGILAFIIFYVVKEIVLLLRDKGKQILATALENKESLKIINGKIDKLTIDVNTAFVNIKKIREKTEMGPIETPKVDQ